MKHTELKQGKVFMSASCADCTLKSLKLSTHSKVQRSDTELLGLDATAGLQCSDL